MSESNHISRGPRDRTRVDVDQLWEMEWWSKGWGISIADLQAGVREVGPVVADLDRYFRR